MSEKKQQLKATIITNILVLSLSFVMLATMTFAWFMAGFSAPAEQVMHIGVFEIKLSDGKPTGETESQLIKVDAAYPMTFADAKTQAANGEKVVYSFEIENTGTVTAQIRLSAQVKADTGAGAPENSALLPLSQQIRFATKIFFDPTLEPSDWNGISENEGGILFKPSQDSALTSFKQYFNNKLLYNELGTDKYFANETGVLYPKSLVEGIEGESVEEPKMSSKIYIKLLVWLDSAATVESTGAITASVGITPRLDFIIKVSALQKGGGAHFTLLEIQDSDAEKTPEAVTVTVGA